MRAFCFASGLIEFGDNLPEGAMPIAMGRAKPLRDFIEGQARHGYKTEVVDGRPTKVKGTEHLLVPGIPEAEGHDKFKAFKAFIERLRSVAPKGVEVL